MRLGLFATWAGREAAGPETYERYLVRGLAAVDPDNEYHVYCLGPEARDSFGITQPNMRFHVLRPRNRWVSIPLTLPAALASDRVQLAHMLSVPPPFTWTPYVFTMHSLTTFTHPEFYDRVVLWRLNQLIHRGLAAARVIICISEAVRDETAARFRIPPERLAVAYHGVSEAFRPVPDDSTAQAARARWGIDRPYVLYTGKLQTGKNIVGLLDAFTRLRAETRRPLQLVLAGKLTGRVDGIQDAISRLAATGDLLQLGHVAHEQLPTLYSGAEMFVFPSLGEGFGLPVIEAMACGTPVITSDCSSLPEIAGNAALLVDPGSVDALTEAMGRLATDSALRGTYRQRGLERALRFTWKAAARQTLAAYAQARSQGTPRWPCRRRR